MTDRRISAVIAPFTILIILLFSKDAYAQTFQSFYTFYLMDKFGVSIQLSQVMLFCSWRPRLWVRSGGIPGDRVGRDRISWFSILGTLPFTPALPYAGLLWTGVLTVVIDLIMSSAFAAILIYAMELMPGRVGLVGGFFYGLTFGPGGIAAADLGALADRYGIETVYRLCSFLSAIGLLARFLPRMREA